MRATVDAALFAKAVKAVAPVASRVTHIAALGCVRLDFTGDQVRLLASDPEHSMETTVSADIADEGVVCAPAHVLARAVGPFAGTLTLVAEPGELYLIGHDAEVSVRTVAPDDYPKIDLATDGAEPLGDAWGRLLSILHHASVDPAADRARLRAIYIEGSGHAYATDGYGLGWCEVPEAIGRAVIPSAGVRRALAALGDQVSLAVTESQATWTDGVSTVASRLIVADDINWRPLVPQSPPHTLEVEVGAVLAAIEVATSVDDPALKLGRTVTFTVDDDRLIVTRSITDVGAARATIDALGEWPDPVRFRPDQLVACIKATGVDTVKFGAFTNRKPVLIEGGDVGQLVMPVVPV